MLSLDIMQEILLLLPVKSLMRLMCTQAMEINNLLYTPRKITPFQLQDGHHIDQPPFAANQLLSWTGRIILIREIVAQ